MGRGKGAAEVEASSLKVYKFAYCTKFCAQLVTKFRRILWNSVEYRGIPQKFTVLILGNFDEVKF